MAGLFGKPPAPPAVPTIDDKEVDEKRRRQAELRQAAGGHNATILAGSQNIGPILGAAAALGGGAS